MSVFDIVPSNFKLQYNSRVGFTVKLLLYVVEGEALSGFMCIHFVLDRLIPYMYFQNKTEIEYTDAQLASYSERALPP